MSGYDKHPDYGGPPVAWWKVAALMIGAGAVYFYVSFGHAAPMNAAPHHGKAVGASVELTSCSGCGCRGGPGWRSKKTGKCVGEKQLAKECGRPPSRSKCTKEN